MPDSTRRDRSIPIAIIALLAIFASALGCAKGVVADGSGGGIADANGVDPKSGPADQVCLLHNCNADAECGACDQGRTSCLLSEHRCVACGANGGACPEGQSCSSFGQCVPAGATCPADVHGTPTISCATSADCVACDPMHQVCDPSTSKCVACTSGDTSACQSTDACVAGACVAKCPKSCGSDGDCGSCGAAGHEAHACNLHKCSECSNTHPCPNGEACSAEGACVKQCGTGKGGVCQSDADCAGCDGNANVCHQPINGGDGKCGPAASGCSDLGQAVVLPDPFNQITNLCSGDADCAGVGIQFNVGKMLRDFTGISQIKDADVDYGMNVCASVSVGSGNAQVSCGVCVPCKVDSDCKPIDVDQVAGQAFGPLGSIAASLLLDEVFGNNDHKVHLFCQPVAGDYGVCAPCPGLLNDCSVGGGGGGGGVCDHDTCTAGGPLQTSCDACTQALCAVDSYCCSTAWDSTCVSEVDQYCGTTCNGGGGGGGCAHDECTAGDKLDSSCSACATSLCAADSYCCSTTWDATCVSEVAQYCANGCGGGGSSSSSSSSSGGGSACAHDECVSGEGLDPSCSDCASALCAADSYCCSSSWDATCVSEVAQYCAFSC